MASKTGGSLKGVFDPVKKAAAAAIMEPPAVVVSPDEKSPELVVPGPVARDRKAGGRGVRVSGYVPRDLHEFLRDEVVRRTIAERRSVSLNDVLCEALAALRRARGGEPPVLAADVPPADVIPLFDEPQGEAVDPPADAMEGEAE
jgi:hypothetical protein